MTSTDTWRQYAKIQAQVEAKFLPKVYSSLNKQNAKAIAYLKQYGPMRLRADLDSVVTYDLVLPVISALYEAAGLKNAENAYNQVKSEAEGEKAAGQMGFSRIVLDRIKNYFRTFLMNKATIPITETTKKRINEVLDQANEEGWGVDKTVKEIGDKDITKKRAEVITRTETVRASNYGAMIGAAQMGLKLIKEWISVRDARTRPDHKKLDGQQVDFADKFVVPDNGIELMYPGDPNAPAKEVIQCRCVVGFHPVRDKRGRLIKFNYDFI